MTARGVKAEEVVAFVAGYIAERGYSPTIREVGDAVGMKSTHTVWKYLTWLRQAERVTWVDNSQRTLRVIHRPPQEGETTLPRMESSRGELATPPARPEPLVQKES